MDMKKVLLVKFLKNYEQSQLASITTANASNRYPRGCDQSKYNFTVRCRY